MKVKKFCDLTFETLEPVSYYMKEFDNSFVMNIHAHEYLEIMYCESGKFNLEILESNKATPPPHATYAITSGVLVFIDALTPHKIKIEPNEKPVIYNIEFAVKSPFDNNKFDINNIVKLDLGKLIRHSPLYALAKNPAGYLILRDTSDIGHSMRRYISELSVGINSLCDALVVSSRLILLLTEIGKSLSQSVKTEGSHYIRKATQFIKNNFMLNISIQDIAEHVGINKAYLQRLFKKYTGMTIFACINNYRIENCKHLLSTTNLSIDDIANKTGFQNRQHLIYVFKKYYNCSPSQFRKDCLKQQVDHKFENYESKLYD